MLKERDVERREEFKHYEMKKEGERREILKAMTKEQREKEEQRRMNQNGKHEKMHEPVSTFETFYNSCFISFFSKRSFLSFCY